VTWQKNLVTGKQQKKMSKVLIICTHNECGEDIKSALESQNMLSCDLDVLNIVEGFKGTYCPREVHVAQKTKI